MGFTSEIAQLKSKQQATHFANFELPVIAHEFAYLNRANYFITNKIIRHDLYNSERDSVIDCCAFLVVLKSGLHEPRLEVEWSVTFLYSLVVERRC